MKHVSVAFAVVCLAAAWGWSEEPGQPKSVLAERGKLLFQDDLTKPLSKEWTTAKGKWEVVNGAIRGSEKKEDMHGAVTRHPMDFNNVIIQYSFKLEGAKTTSLSINKAKGHLCRVVINPSGFHVQRDKDKKKPDDKGTVFDSRKLSIASGVWHTMVVELLGNEMAATLDGKEIAFGSDPALATAKANFGFTVAGASVSFKDLKVYEALPNKNWEATKAKILTERKKSGQ